MEVSYYKPYKRKKKSMYIHILTSLALFHSSVQQSWNIKSYLQRRKGGALQDLDYNPKVFSVFLQMRYSGSGRGFDLAIPVSGKVKDRRKDYCYTLNMDRTRLDAAARMIGL